MKFFIDIFPINTAVIPQLFAYTIDVATDDLFALGGKLAYRLKKKFGSNWIWCNGQIISDNKIPDADLNAHLEELWTQDEKLANIRRISSRESWKPLAWEIGDYVARGVLSNYQNEIRKIIEPKKHDFNDIQITRDYSLRGWAVDEKPALSICVSSNIVCNQNLAEYVALNIQDIQKLLGMMVLVVEKGFKGEICEITGKLSEQRKWLLSKSTDEVTRKLIECASDDELTVKIATRQNKYVYIASMLRPIVRICDLKSFFKVDPRKVLKILKIDPDARSALIREIAAIGKQNNIIFDNYDSEKYSGVFLTTKELEYIPKLRVGNNQIHYGNQRIYESLQKHGLFCRSALFPDKNHPIKVGIINANQEESSDNMKSFLNKLKVAIENLGFSIESVKVDGKRQQKIDSLTRVNLETAVNRFKLQKPDILLVLFPGEAGGEYIEDDFDDNMYHALKSYTIREGIPSQVVYEKTLSNDYAIENIVLGILAKTGNIPFILAEPLPYADIVVGIDIARRQKKKLSGSVNATAIARIYMNDGQFLRYVIHDAPIDGETIPAKVLRSLFPVEEFREKRVIIHRDGLFRGDEKKVLTNWALEIQAEFMLVEVIKSGAPRIYQQTEIIDKPPKGTAFKLNYNEAFLVSSPPPFKGSTSRPIHIRTDGNFPIEKAIHSVLSLTLLHYGSVREPRLPVTIHYSDKIAELSLLGIKPKNLEGDIPFWL